MIRLAIVVSHPIQYYAPWFAQLATKAEIQLRVFYLWDFGAADGYDHSFNRKIKWDLDLLTGYESEFVENVAKNPGTSTFRGLDNPDLPARLEEYHPDAILCFGYGWKSLWNLAKNWRSGPIILRGDSHHLGRMKTNFLREMARSFLLRRTFRSYRAFACVGQANRAFYEQHGVSTDRLFHVPHSVDNDRFAATTKAEAHDWRDSQNIATNAFLILFAGKLEMKKRPDLLLRAFALADLPHANLVVVGSGEMETELHSSAEELGDQVKFPGFINQSEMPSALRAADLVVLPSEGSGETWGLIINEAMACGTPAIVSDHVGCAQDLIIENNTGWVFRAGDLDHLLATIRLAHHAITSSPERFAEATRDHISNYSIESSTQGLLKLLSAIPDSIT